MTPTIGALMRRSATCLAIGLAFSLTSGAGFAAGDEANLEKLGAFKKTATPPPKRIAQDPAYIANLKKMLTNVKLPDGFKIDVFAVVPDARTIAVSRNTAAVWVGTRKNNVYYANDRDMDNVATLWKISAPASSSISPLVFATRPMALCTSSNATVS